MSENGGGWPQSPPPPQSPRPPQHSRGFQNPRGPQNPRIPQTPQGSRRLPDGDAWRPDEYLRPLPPGYEPVHHEPRYDDPRPARPQDQGGPEDSPWRRTQRLSRPEAQEWHPGQPAQASYDPGDFRPPDQYGEHGQYGESGDVEYEDEYEAGGRFVPGFGDEGDADYEDGLPIAAPAGPAARTAAGEGGVAAPGAGSAGSRRWPRC